MQARCDGKKELRARTSTRNLFGPIGTSQDQTSAVLLLQLERASSIIGAEPIVDGGPTARPRSGTASSGVRPAPVPS